MQIEQLEALALGEDREKALASLIPGTEDYYFHHCLHRQLTGRLDEVPPLLRQWISRHGRTERAERIERRQALLTFERDPKRTAEQLASWLGLSFDHQREVEVEAKRYPSALDPRLVSRAELLARAKKRTTSDLSPFEETALFWLGEELTPAQRQHFLDRVPRPDHPRVLDWVIEDLDNPRTGGFGTRRIHQLLFLDQLDVLKEKRPALLEQSAFVHAYLAKLAPSPDVDLDDDPVEREAWFDRLWAFVKKLSPSFNPLALAVLHHRLRFDRSRGIYDRGRFLEYLRLPRHSSYAHPGYLEKHERFAVTLGSDRSADVLGLETFSDDEWLVRAYVEHFVVLDPSIEDFAPYVRKEVLLRWRAFAMIAAGIGDQERWYAEIDDPIAYQEYQERVDIELLPENRIHFRANEPVRLAVNVKNVRDLVVKIFEINTKNYFLEHGAEVTTAIDLDGLEAGEERTITFDQSPLRIVRHELDLPSLSKPGVYVVELIGNGRSSRALIKKGTLRLLERLSAAGHAFTVLDEEKRVFRDASIWMGGTEHRADETGEIVIPYSTRPERKQILLSSGDLTAVETFHHRAEQYRLAAGFYLDREQLLRDAKAKLIVRAALYLNDHEISLDILEDVRLSIVSTDGEGTQSSLDLPSFALGSDRESVHEIQVPKDLRSLDVSLRAKVKSMSERKRIDLEVSDRFSVNGIDGTDRTHDLFLSRTDAGYVLYLYGKTGEPLAHKAINVSLKHRDFVERVDVVLETDERGRIELGDLAEITNVSAKSPAGVTEQWALTTDAAVWPSTVHACRGETIRLPAIAGTLSLLERRSGSFQKDWSEQIAIERGQIAIAGLPPGDYELFAVEQRTSVAIRVTAGPIERGWALSEKRQLEVPARAKLAIERTVVTDSTIELRLAAFSASTRVHVLATRFLPGHRLLDALARVRDPEPRAIRISKPRSSYVSGRDIGDEYRYILERKYRKKFPGNMLARPGLLLNPWSIRKTHTDVAVAGGGGTYAAAAERRAREEAARRAAPAKPAAVSSGFSSFDFLGAPSFVEVNLRPDEKGVVRIDRAALGDVSLVTLVAVDKGAIVKAEALLPEAAHRPRDLRLLAALDPKRHVTQKKERTLLTEGGRLVIEDATTAEVEAIDTLAKAYGVLSTLTDDPALAEFSFVLDWPNLDESTKRKKYSEYACHELNLFLERKDPAFFLSVVKPYLAHKKDKTFLDRYLIGDDLSDYLEPWAYGRLNTMERILLGKVIDGEAEAVRRHVKDKLELIEKNVEEEERLFQSMLKKSALETTDALGLSAALDAGAATMRWDLPEAEPMPSAPKKARRFAKAAKAGPPADDFEAAEIAADFDEAPGEEQAKLDRDRARRAEIRPLFRQLDKTEEWAENNYWHRRIQEQNANLIPVNGFWKDFADHDGKGPFLSARFVEATSCFAESMCALALLDLPFTAAQHEVKYEGARMELTARSNAIVVHREIKPAKIAEKKTPILVSQNYFEKDDRYEWEDGEQREKYVTGELVAGVPYVCQVVLTNPTASRSKLDLLLQIPAGAIPLDGGFFTKGRPVVLEPYSTESIEYTFYFPSSGSFTHYGVRVSKNEELVAFAPESAPLSVVREPTEIDTRSWSWVSQHGTTEDLLRFLDEQNVERLDLERIAWRMRDREVFEKVTELLTRRHRYDDVLWSYAHRHLIPERMREHLLHQEDFLKSCGPALESALLTIDPVAHTWYEHLEYAPLVNARAHRLGGRLTILNSALDQQYRAMLDVLCHRKARSPDLLAAAYYLFLQDRVEDALACLERVNASEIPSRLQLDYLSIYAALYRGDLRRARELAQANAAHPVDRWRKLFEGALAVLDEAEDGETRIADGDDRGQEQAKLASMEPSFELSVEGKSILIRYRNLSECRVSYYGMEIELLFSRQPFVQQDSARFSMIKPGRSDRIALPEDRRELSIPLPVEFHGRNVIVEVVAAGQKKAVANYAHELSVQIAEQYGHLYVRRQNTNAALPEAYVKVFARMRDGRIAFYKDGYTDVRGCFDYTSLSTDELDRVERFSILVITDRHGAVIREAGPPLR